MKRSSHVLKLSRFGYMIVALAVMAAAPIAWATGLTLTWSDNSDNEDGFRIERSIDGTAFSEISTVDANLEIYSDSDLAAETTFWYRVRAYNSAGNSGYSNTGSATTAAEGGSDISVNLDSPENGAVFDLDETVSVAVTVDKPTSTDRVELLIDGEEVGEDANSPYIFLWSGAEIGAHTVQARAVDLDDGTFVSELITILVQDPTNPNEPPVPGVYRGGFTTPAIGADESSTPAADDQETGRFSIWIDADGTMRFLGFDTTTETAFSVSDVTLAGDGTFVVLGSSDGEPVIVRGRIDSKGIEGTVDGTGLTLSGSLVDEDGPSSSVVGVYEAFGVRTPDTCIMVIVGADGLSFMTVSRDGVVRGAEIPVLISETGAYLSSDDLNAEITLDFESGAAEGLMTAEGGQEIWLMGLRSDIAALRRLENISTRGSIAAGAGLMITGFVVSGSDTKDVLIRAIGPGLAAFGVANPVQDPALELISDTGTIATNSRWIVGNVGSVIETVSTQVGAFPLDPDSHDAALLVTVTPGRYSVVVNDASAQGGNTLIEIYDATDLGDTGSDLINLSTRGSVGLGGYLVGGFVVSGNTPKRVLIRGVGPGLESFGVVNALSETKLVLTQRVDGEDVAIGENVGWASQPNADGIVEATGNAGAFALDPANQDSAMLLWLEPGVYTATVQPGSSGLTGTALIEVYQTD